MDFLARVEISSILSLMGQLEETARLYLLLRGNRLKILTPEQVAELHRKWPQ